VAFEGTMENHVAGTDAVAAGIASFVIAARQHDRGERFAVAVARQGFAGCVAHPTRRRTAEQAM